MNKTQFLIFEICRECHLSHMHTWCPSGNPERFALSAERRPVTDDQIVNAVREAYTVHGFAGLIGWHYYNEPLAAWWRVKPLMDRIKREVPAARFVLWTNGEQLPTNLADLHAFEQIHVTDYADRGFAQLATFPGVVIDRPAIDRRATAGESTGNAPCRRPYTEIIVDYYGNLHACCYDWRGKVRIGNVHDDTWPVLLTRWQAMRRSISGDTMTATAPEACRTCSMRRGRVPSFVPAVADAARQHWEQKDAPVAAPPPPPMPEPATQASPPTVVAVAYRIPAQRVQDFCRWNAAAFLVYGVRLVLVVESPYQDLPHFVTQITYAATIKVFSLTRTKNAGIRAALAGGARTVIASDIDLAIPAETLEACLAVPEGAAVVPLYKMADTYEYRESVSIDARLATGTVSMRASGWRQVQYEERCEGYGSDDAILFRALSVRRIIVTGRDLPVYHIAHQPGTPQREFAGRTDHWGRDTGFNPENFHENRQYMRGV